MKTIIVDDEGWSLKQLAGECNGSPEIQLIGQFCDPTEALHFAEQNLVELVFSDIEMPRMNGLELAGRLRNLYPKIIIIFVSAYEKYMSDAYRIQADYFITKPYSSEDIVLAIQRAKLLSRRLDKPVAVRTFGPFEVLVNEQPLDFPSPVAKEFFALLVDRNGRTVSPEETIRIIWGKKRPSTALISKYRSMLEALKKSLAAVGLQELLLELSGGVAVKTNALSCDYYRFINGDTDALRFWHGEYLPGYSWAKSTKEKLSRQWELFSGYQNVDLRSMPCASVRFMMDDRLTFTYANDAFLALTGFSRNEISTAFENSLAAMLTQEDAARLVSQITEQTRSLVAKEAELRIKTKSGSFVWVLSRGEYLRLPNGSKEAFCVMLDISNSKLKQTNLQDKVEKDTFTGLYNRTTIQSLTEQYISTAPKGSSGIMLVMDIDDFKSINDNHGHPFGDVVIMDVASALTQTFRANDIIGRIGGDEMMVFMRDVPNVDIAFERANAALTLLMQKTGSHLEGVHATCSFGISVFPSDGRTFEELYAKADSALYYSKNHGKGCATIFSETGSGSPEHSSAQMALGTTIDTMDPVSGSGRQFIDYSFRQLRDSENLFQSIRFLLGILGQRLSLSRTYIFENTDDGEYIVNTFEWCADGISSEISNLQQLPVSMLSNYFSSVKENGGVFVVGDTRAMLPELRAIVEPQGILSLLICELSDKNGSFGLVGFDECVRRRYWNGHHVFLLSEFSKTVGVFLRMYRLQNGSSLEQLQNTRFL